MDVAPPLPHRPPLAVAPPFSRALQRTAGTALVLAALLNGLPQFLGHQLTGDLAFGEQIVWAADHPLVHRAEQTALLLSSLVMPIGVLGLAHVCRFCAPRLTAVATVLAVWGLWGFANVLAMGFVSGTVAPRAVGTPAAVRLDDALPGDPGVLVGALLPHLIGSFLGLLLLCAAAWRSGFPRVALVLLAAFLVWDFLLPPVGPLEPHLLLAVSWTWLGVHLLRLPHEVWRHGPRPAGAGQAA